MRGFSLLELLISMAILAILVAIAIPSYSRYRKSALLSKVQQEVVNCATELTTKYADGGVKTLDCVVPGATGNCTLQISERGYYVKIANDYCDFNIEGLNIRCFIKTNYGDVNGFIYCEFR